LNLKAGQLWKSELTGNVFWVLQALGKGYWKVLQTTGKVFRGECFRFSEGAQAGMTLLKGEDYDIAFFAWFEYALDIYLESLTKDLIRA